MEDELGNVTEHKYKKDDQTVDNRFIYLLDTGAPELICRPGVACASGGAAQDTSVALSKGNTEEVEEEIFEVPIIESTQNIEVILNDEIITIEIEEESIELLNYSIVETLPKIPVFIEMNYSLTTNVAMMGAYFLSKERKRINVA